MDSNWNAPSFIRPDEQTIIHADIDSRNAGWVYPADIGLIGDAATTLEDLSDRGTSQENGSSAKASEAKASFEPEFDTGDEMVPSRVVKELEAIVDEDTIICSDAGNNRMWLFNYFASKEPRTFFGPGGVGVMGWAAPAAVSLALTSNSPTVSVSGDGGFTMTMTAVETAVELGVAPTFVVLNDQALSSVRDFESHHESIDGVRFHEIDYATTAQSFGAEGITVNDVTSLEKAFEAAFENQIATVLDIRIDGAHDVFGDQGLQSSFYANMSGGLHE